MTDYQVKDKSRFTANLAIYLVIGLFVWFCFTARGFGQSQTVTYTYDNLNRLISVTYQNGPTITYTYDAAGNRLSSQVTGGTCPTITLSPPTLPNGTSGISYNQTITASGGTSPYTFIVLSGVLPTGLSLSTSGVLNGTPSTNNTFSFMVKATDSIGCQGTQAYSVTISPPSNGPPTISAVAATRQQGSPVSSSTIANVSDANQAANTLTVTVNGGATATVNGVTVSGISVNSAGVVTANVVASCTAATANFTLTVTDNAAAFANATLNVTVTPNSAPILTYGNQSVAAGGSLTVDPASGPSDNGSVSSIVALSQGTFAGMITSVNSITGAVSLSNAKPGGTHTITIRATDNCGAVTDTSFTLTVTCPTITLAPTSLPASTVGTSYNQTITANGGIAPYSFVLLSGALPTGLNLSTIGVLSGTPSTNNTFNFTVQATDSNGCAGALAYTIVVGGACPTVSNVSPTLAGVGASVRINGTNLAGVTSVKFSNNVNATIISNTGTQLTVAVPAGAVTGPITLSKAGCSDVLTASVTVCSTTPATLAVDDGSIESSFGFDVDVTMPYFVNRLTPASYPATLSEVVANISLPVGTPVQILVGNNVGGGTNINGTGLQVTNTTVATQDAFASYAVNPVTINSGDFVVGFRYTNAANLFPANSDDDAPSGSRSYYSENGTTYDLLTGDGGPVDLLIRATVYNGGCNGCPTITLNPTTLPNGTVGQPYNQTITASGGNAPYTFAIPVGSPVLTRFDASGSASIPDNNPVGVDLPVTVSGISSPLAKVTVSLQLSHTWDGDLRLQLISPDGTTVDLADNRGDDGDNYGTVCSPDSSRTSFDNAAATSIANGTSPFVGTFSPEQSLAVFNSKSGPAVNGVWKLHVVDSGLQDIGTINCLSLFLTQNQPLPGLSLNASGMVMGTPTTTGMFNFTVAATDANSCTGTQVYTLLIANPANNPPTINAVVATRQQGSPVSNSTIANVSDANQAANTLTVTVNGGSSATVNNVTVSGIGISPAGVVTANVIAACTATNASFTLTVTDNTAASANATLNVTVNNNTPPTLTYGNQSVAAGGALTINPATGPSDNGSVSTITLLSQGTYAGVISINNSTGVISLSGAKPGGAHTITIRSTDNCGNTTDAPLTLTVNCQTITVGPVNTTLPAGTMGSPYSQTFTQTGNIGTITWSNPGGGLPGGLSLDPSTGILSGTPIAQGAFSFFILATDANNCFGERQYSLSISFICPMITINPSNPALTAGTVGTAYTQTFTQVNGAGTIMWSVSAGTLPGGLTINPSTGVLSGNPTTAGNSTFTIQAKDANNCLGSRQYMLTINPLGNGLQFYPLPRPVRLLDTRASQGNCDNVSTPIPAGTSITTQARITCESIAIPSTAQAIVGNITVLNGTNQTGFLTIYPAGQPLPLAANMIYTPGDIISNAFTVGLNSNGEFNIFGERTIDVVVDISGYYAPPLPAGLYYHPLPKPIRLLDTRAGEGNCDSVSTPIPGGTSLTTLARVTCEALTIPAAAQAIVGNATVINGSGQTGYLTIYPNGVPVPLAANMVYFPGQILSNAFTVSLNAAGEFNLFGERTINMVIDVAGYYSTEANDVNGAGLLFTPLARPLRILDTRASQGNCDNVGTPIPAGTSIAVPARITCESITIPAAAQTVIGTVTVINPNPIAGYMTMYPDGVAQPLAANMVYFPGQLLSNAFAVGLNATSGQFRIFGERTIEAIVDVSGYFAP